MITYDYLIDRNIGEEKSIKFSPGQIPTKLKNVIVIEGPNSSGKSTLLNIIALGLLGTKSSRINPTLQSKMSSLLDLNHQKIKFSFQITLDHEKLILKSEKNDIDGTEFIVKESIDGKTFHPLSFESFEKKYNLIYDIPNNPTERLPELLKELKEEQFQFGNRFKDFGFFLHNIITEINSSRNPERLKQLKKKLAEEERNRKKLAKELPELEAFLDLLEKNAYAEYYYYYNNEGEWLTKRKNKLEQEIKKIKGKGRKITTTISKTKGKLDKLQVNFTEDYKKVTPLIQSALPKNERSRFKIWKDVNPYCSEINELNTVKIEATHVQDIFGREIEGLKKDQSFIDARILAKLFYALEEFEDSILMIPELEVTIAELVGILRKEIDKSSIMIKKYDILNQINGFLKDLKITIKELQTTQKELEQESAASENLCEDIDGFDEKKRQFKKMEDDLALFATKCNEYFQRCISKGVNQEKLENLTYKELVKEMPRSGKVNQYLSLTEKQVLDKIEKLQDEIVEKRGQLSGLDTVMTQRRKDVKSLENQKPHKFEAHINKLNDLHRKTEAISQKILSKYNTNLKNLINKKVKEDQKLDKDESRYYDEVSKYLAHRIGYFRHIDRTYRAKVVDLISGKIETDSEEVIYISDMGTGQTQSAYILSLLNIKNDDRMIIALFDEIAMMDDASLEPIYVKMRELYKSNQLLLGILVQKSNELTVKELV
ncbi:MAG: AAA family ATPase [Candidatus Hodarchaeota archaeon]